MQPDVLKEIQQKPGITRQEIMDNLALGSTSVSNSLTALKKKQKIRALGINGARGRKVQYFPMVCKHAQRR